MLVPRLREAAGAEPGSGQVGCGVDDVTLTPTEAAAEGMIRRDPLRRLTDETLRTRITEARAMARMLSDSREAWRAAALRESVEAMERELRRRAHG